ncbi:hypothetical protein DV736_g1148, partial [Chaetothyriales sp. CBS 134916]
MSVLEDDIRCGSCNKMLNRARFSNTALSKYQSALFAARSRSNTSGMGDVRQPNCRDCTGGGRQEMFCQGCQKTFGLDRFSKSQRRKPDNAHCWDCVQASEDRVGDVKEAIEEQKILEMLESPSATSTAAFNTGSLQGALSSINKHYSGNSTHSYIGRSAVSNDSGAVWIRPDTSFPSRDGGGMSSGMQEHDVDSDSGETTQSTAMNTPSIIGRKSNGGWDDSTPIEQAFRRKSSTASYATGGANSGFVKQGAYRPDVNQRAMDQHRRDQALPAADGVGVFQFMAVLLGASFNFLPSTSAARGLCRSAQPVPPKVYDVAVKQHPLLLPITTAHVQGRQVAHSGPAPLAVDIIPRRPLDSPAMAHSVLDPEQKRSRGSSAARDGYASDSSRYSHAKQPINDAITSAFTAAPAGSTATTIPPELLAQITSHVIQQLRLVNLSVASHSPHLGGATVYTPPSPRKAAEEGTRLQRPPGDKSSRVAESDKDDRSSRPKGPQGISNEADITIVERVWGDLFTEHGEGTTRLGQFLRGVALHIIADYEPKHSLVITPEKMQRYYEETKLDNETYPWQVIFDDRTSSISRMFREVSAQHHLIQPHGKENERPDVPGLTPPGFATWATLLIKAHPSHEFERLAKTARDMPISNPDDPKERFPKEISRRLFPERSDEAIAAKLQRAMSIHCNVSFNARQDSTEDTRSNTNATNPKRNSVSISEQGQPPMTPVLSNESVPQPAERPNKVVSHTDSGVVIDDDTPTVPPIERKRKPYVAAPGGGKTYGDQGSSAAEVKPVTTETKVSSSLPSAGWNDQPKPRPVSISVHLPKPTPSAPVDIPETRRHRGSTTYRDQPSAAAPHRARSPSVGQTNGYGRRSDPDYGYGNSYASGSSLDNGDTARRYREYDSFREKYSSDRYDPARMAACDGRDHERGDTRARGHSISTTPRTVYVTDDEYYKKYGGYPPHSATVASSRDAQNNYVPSSTPSSAVYPPTAFRELRADASDPGVGSGRRTKDSDSFGDYTRTPTR